MPSAVPPRSLFRQVRLADDDGFPSLVVPAFRTDAMRLTRRVAVRALAQAGRGNVLLAAPFASLGARCLLLW